MRNGSSGTWFPRHSRFLTRRERLAAMGVPAYRDLAAANGSEHEAGDIDLINDASVLLGNAMHRPTVGCIVAVVLACVRLVPQ